MPLLRSIAKSNRVVLNPLIRRFAGKFRPFAILVHRGRTSGRQYRTPIMAFPAGDGFVIALVYGRHTDWERNVVSAGGCELVYRNQSHTLVTPRFVDQDEARTSIPAPICLVLRAIRVDSFLRLDET